jgi:hypothetical protein
LKGLTIAMTNFIRSLPRGRSLVRAPLLFPNRRAQAPWRDGTATLWAVGA